MERKIEDLEKTEMSTAAKRFAQIGSTGLERYGGYVQEEFLYNLRMPTSTKVYQEMSSNDATIGALLFLFESMMKRLPWDVEPGGDKLVDKTVANFVNENMHDMVHSWVDFINDVLSMFPYGWAWAEIVYKKRTSKNSKYDDGRIGWEKLLVISQKSWNRWVYDENDPDKLIGIEQSVPNVRKEVIIPYEKSLLFRTKTNRNNPEGVSLLRTAYRSWYFKKKIEEIEGIGIERDLAGLPVLKVPADLDIWNKENLEAVQTKAHLEKLISNIRRDKNEGVLIPDTYDFSLVSTGSSRQFDTNKIIDRYDMRIAMSVLSDLILMGHTNSGSFALAKEKKNLLAASLEAVADSIADVINTIAIPRLLNMNTFRGYTKYPKLRRGEIEVPDMTKLVDAMTKFSEMGMRFFPHEPTEKYIRNCFGLPPVTEKEKKEMEDKAKEEEEKFNNADGGLPPRKTEEHQTDDKGEFNDTYEEAGMKKFLRKLFGKGDGK